MLQCTLSRLALRWLVTAVMIPPAQGEKHQPLPLNRGDLCGTWRAGGKHGGVNDIYLAAPPHLQPLSWLCKEFAPHANSPMAGIPLVA